MKNNNLIKILASENKLMEVSDVLYLEKDKISYLHLLVNALSQENLDKRMSDFLINAINNKPQKRLLNNNVLDNISYGCSNRLNETISFVYNDVEDTKKIVSEIKKNKNAETVFLNYFDQINNINFNISLKKHHFIEELYKNDKDLIRYFLYNTNANIWILSHLINDKNISQEFYYDALENLCKRDKEQEINRYFDLSFLGDDKKYLDSIDFVIKNANKETLKKTINYLIDLYAFEGFVYMDKYLHSFLNNNIKTFEMTKFIKENENAMPLSSSLLLKNKINKKIKKEFAEKTVYKKRKI